MTIKSKYGYFCTYFSEIANHGPSRTTHRSLSDEDSATNISTEFFDFLYVPVPIEKLLRSRLNRNVTGQLITLCGPSGSGKSTVSLRVIQELQNREGTKVVYVGIREAASGKAFDGDRFDRRFLRDRIISDLRRDIKRTVRNQYTPEFVNFMKYLFNVKDTDSDSKEPNLFASTDMLALEVQRLYERTSSATLKYEDWFENNVNTLDELRQLIARADDLVDISHLLYYFKHAGKYEHFVVWIDNIDALDNLKQSEVVGIVQEIQRAVLNQAQFVIAVREENIYRTGKINDNFNEPYVSKVAFVNPEKNVNHSEYEACNISVLGEAELSTIVIKKLLYCQKNLDTDAAADSAKLKYLNDSLHTLRESDGNFSKKRQSLLSGIDELNSIVNERNENRLSPGEFKTLVDFATQVTHVFELEKAILLANNSVKQYIKMFAKFLEHMMSYELVYSNGHFIGNQIAVRDLVTEFLSWVHNAEEPFGLPIFNIVQELHEFEVSDRRNLGGCFLPYLLITRTWNEMLRLQQRVASEANPKVEFIIQSICNDFGYEQDEVKKAIYDLYTQTDGRASFITFRSKQGLVDWSGINMKTTMRVTYRGRAAVGTTINSYGYIRECIRKTIGFDLLKVDDSNQIVEYVNRIVRMHVKGLCNIKLHSNSGSLWFDQYLGHYGIPMDSRFVRNDSLGRALSHVGGVRRSLFLETLFSSILSYRPRGSILVTMIEKLQGKFNYLLSELESESDCRDFDLN